MSLKNKKNTLSVALATYNEEKNIERCLKSVKNIADEIVIVDGSSQDRTVEIAKKNNAKVLSTTNPKIFHVNKQKALDLCTSEWILQLDADEVVSKKLSDEIVQVINSNPKENGFWIPRLNFFLGRFLRKGGQYPDYTMRLYRKGKAHLPQKTVHEQAEVDGETNFLKQDLLHYPYKNFAHYLKKLRTYYGIQAHEINEELKNKSTLQKVFSPVTYLIVKPLHWFLLTYARHKGFVDSWQGFLFSLFSSTRFPAGYILYLIQKHDK